ncbi:hypothetical protein ACJJTC_005570 [Scirpophaga incertulas]
MTQSESTRSKSVSESAESESTEDSIVSDRWSNNITYRQLVVSSCIGIMQTWWNPYIHDLRKLVPFMFLYNVFSITIAYPMFYLELALGVVTKKGVLRCWDLVPMARGIGVAMMLCCVLTAFALGGVSAWCLAMLVHSWHTFIPWLHCAAIAMPACAARHRPLSNGSETPAQSFLFNFILNLKRDGFEGGLGNVVWELSAYYIICWVLIYFICMKRIYSYSKLVLFKDVTAFFVLLCFVLGASRLNGAGAMFKQCDWSVLFDNLQIWRDAVEYSLMEMGVCQGVLVILGALCPKQKHKLSYTALLSFAASKTTTMTSVFILGATHGALQIDYDTNTTYIWDGSSASVVLWADYVARMPGSQFWSSLLFFTLLVLSLSSTALLLQTVMSTVTGHTLRKVTWAFLVLGCFLFSIIGVITLCTQGGLYVLNFLMQWPVAKPRVLIAALSAIVITYLYGQSTFCEDVYFVVGEYPGVFMRVCWALTPIFLLSVFLSEAGSLQTSGVVGWASVVIAVLLPVGVIMIFYLIFKCRVRNILADEK